MLCWAESTLAEAAHRRCSTTTTEPRESTTIIFNCTHTSDIRGTEWSYTHTMAQGKHMSKKGKGGQKAPPNLKKGKRQQSTLKMRKGGESVWEN